MSKGEPRRRPLQPRGITANTLGHVTHIVAAEVVCVPTVTHLKFIVAQQVKAPARVLLDRFFFGNDSFSVRRGELILCPDR